MVLLRLNHFGLYNPLLVSDNPDNDNDHAF